MVTLRQSPGSSGRGVIPSVTPEDCRSKLLTWEATRHFSPRERPQERWRKRRAGSEELKTGTRDQPGYRAAMLGPCLRVALCTVTYRAAPFLRGSRRLGFSPLPPSQVIPSCLFSPLSAAANHVQRRSERLPRQRATILSGGCIFFYCTGRTQGKRLLACKTREQDLWILKGSVSSCQQGWLAFQGINKALKWEVTKKKHAFGVSNTTTLDA